MSRTSQCGSPVAAITIAMNTPTSPLLSRPTPIQLVTAVQNLLILLLAIILLWLVQLRWPRPLHLELASGSSSGTMHTAGSAGNYAVVLNVLPLGDDNGPAHIRVVINGRPTTTLDSFYNYDLFANTPAGTTYRWWLDSDWQPDVVITTSHDPPRRYYVSSRSGQLIPLPPAQNP